MNKETNNPLGVQPVNRLLSLFAIPSIISMLVGSLYNIVDQFFIGQRVGELGNAATNIAFPLSTSCLALALLIGIGGSSAFNLAMGSGHEKRAVNIMGNAVVLLAGSGLVLSIITLLFLKPLLLFFGSPKSVLPYAMEYTKITAFGFPFLLLSFCSCWQMMALLFSKSMCSHARPSASPSRKPRNRQHIKGA